MKKGGLERVAIVMRFRLSPTEGPGIVFGACFVLTVVHSVFC